MLTPELIEQTRSYLSLLRTEVLLTASLDDSAAAVVVRDLLSTIGELSEKVSVRLDGTSLNKPSFTVACVGSGARVEFRGAPLGHEFTSLLLAILHVGGHPPRITEVERERVENLAGQFEVVTWYSQTCHNCPDVVQAFNMIAALNPRVRHTAVDGAAFSEEAEKLGVRALPTAFINGEPLLHGRSSLADVLELLEGLEGRTPDAVSLPEGAFDVLVVGGGPAGVSSAVYAARKGLRTGMVAERIGGQVNDTAGIENLIGQVHLEGPALARDLEAHMRAYDIEVLSGLRATGLERADGSFSVGLSRGGELRARSVVLAPGANWRRLGVPGEEEYRNKGVTFCPHCDGPLFKGQKVVVVGGGNSGVEAAIDLAGVTDHVTVVEFGSALRADDVLQKVLGSLQNVTVLTSAEVIEVLGDGDRVTGIRYRDRESGTANEVQVSGVFIQAGLVPTTEWLKGAVSLNARGEVEVGRHGETSLHGVFAAGDATDGPYKQIVTAVGDGAVAALSAFEYLVRETAGV